MHVVGLLCELEILAATLTLTFNSKSSTPSTFLFLCASLFITILAFSSTVFGISTLLRPFVQAGRVVAVSFGGSKEAAAHQRRSLGADVSMAVHKAQAVQQAATARRSCGAAVETAAPLLSGNALPTP